MEDEQKSDTDSLSENMKTAPRSQTCFPFFPPLLFGRYIKEVLSLWVTHLLSPSQFVVGATVVKEAEWVTRCQKSTIPVDVSQSQFSTTASVNVV